MGCKDLGLPDLDQDILAGYAPLRPKGGNFRYPRTPERSMTRSALNPEERMWTTCVTLRPDQREKAKKLQQRRMLSGVLQAALDSLEVV